MPPPSRENAALQCVRRCLQQVWESRGEQHRVGTSPSLRTLSPPQLPGHCGQRSGCVSATRACAQEGLPAPFPSVSPTAVGGCKRVLSSLPSAEVEGTALEAKGTAGADAQRPEGTAAPARRQGSLPRAHTVPTDLTPPWGSTCRVPGLSTSGFGTVGVTGKHYFSFPAARKTASYQGMEVLGGTQEAGRSPFQSKG